MRVRIPVDEARAKQKAGEVTVVDQLTTNQDLRATKKISGSIRIPADELPDRLDELPRDRGVVTYCTCPHDELSTRTALFLRKQGYDAWALEGGMDDWIEAGHPTEDRESEQRSSEDRSSEEEENQG
jgi:rhodanese-related sulfurtransferase